MRKRKPEPTDQDEAEKAYQLMNKTMTANPGISPNAWMAALWTLVVHGHVVLGFSHELFCKEFERVKEFYKPRWDEPK